MELSCYSFDVTDLYHPGVTHFVHMTKIWNLLYSVEDIKEIISSCKIGVENKPKFYRPKTRKIVKTIQPFNRITLGLKGPLPSISRNKYMQIIIDEYLRFLFVIPCPVVSSITVIQTLCSLFTVFLLPVYVHFNHENSLMLEHVRQFFLKQGIYNIQMLNEVVLAVCETPVSNRIQFNWQLSIKESRG